MRRNAIFYPVRESRRGRTESLKNREWASRYSSIFLTISSLWQWSGVSETNLKRKHFT
mgnify:CR=1 FL=1